MQESCDCSCSCDEFQKSPRNLRNRFQIQRRNYPHIGTHSLSQQQKPSIHSKFNYKMLTIVNFLFLTIFLLALLETVTSKATITTTNKVYVQGSKALLSCRVDTSDNTKWHLLQADSQFTLSMDCRVRAVHPRRKLNCKDGWFNLTITDIQWEDRGVYRCANGLVDDIVIEVLVPMNSDSVVKVAKKRNYRNDTSPLRGLLDMRPASSEDKKAVVECTSGCGFRAPKIQWFGAARDVEGNPMKLMIDPKLYQNKEEPCEDDLYRAVSQLQLSADEKSNLQARQNITCEAYQDQQGFPKGTFVNKLAHIPVLYEDNPEEEVRSMGGLQAQPLTTLEIAGIAVGASIFLLLILLGVACYLWIRSRDNMACDDPDAKEKMNANDERV